MRRTAIATAMAAVALVACSTGRNRDFARYYDPEGLFSANLPAANDVVVESSEPTSQGSSVLTGVVSTPPAPSPSPSSAFGGGLTDLAGETSGPQDQTVYGALAVTTGTFEGLPQMALTFLTGDPMVDVQIEDEMPLGGMAGELIVADIVRDDQKVSGVAAAFTLGRQGVGYIVLAIFPPGDWANERSDFLKVAGSFRPGVPPGMRAFPLAGGAA
ncbi:MAG TPA: hypothetical protein VFM85_07540 [Actinomycetota bacterium]|nr:hypothetical protein [Actinomycetota bacterium]